MTEARILIIEDNEITRKMFRVTVESAGWEATEAADGASALAAVAAAVPDLIVSDLTLPDMEGTDLLGRIRSLPGGADIPVVAVSGFLSKLERARTLELGFVDHLLKPVGPERLLRVVRVHLEPPDPSPPGEGLYVVVADDDPSYRQMLTVQLERSGFTVVAVRDAQQALVAALAAPPDAIISDVLMPGMDGFQFCLAVRSDPTLGSIPVVLVTSAYTEEPDRELARRVGANQLVARDPQHRAVIDAVLDGIRREGPAPRVYDARLPAEDYTHRLVRQLERQVEQKAELASRLALHEAAMGVVTRIGETASKPIPLSELVPELLHYALDAAGVSIGAVYLDEASGALVLRASHGLATAVEGLDDFFGRVDLLERVVASGESRSVPAGDGEEPREAELLARIGAGSLLLVAIRLGPARLGVLVLVAADRRLVSDWQPFSEAIGAQIAQSVGLARSQEALRRTEAHLRQAQKMEAVGRLAGGVAHDFNNLLTAMTGYAELIAGGLGEDDPLRDYAEQILTAGRRAGSLTHQLLAFSRKQVLRPRRVDVREIVADMERLLRRVIGENIELRATGEAPVDRVLADRGQIEQVLMNLAVNARDAMPRGGALTIETANVEREATRAAEGEDVAAGPYVMIAVSDTGEGMDEATLARAFEPFFTTKDKDKGTGLGLSTVFGIVKQSGGHVTVESEVGRGTRFAVYLPRAHIAAAEEAKPAEREARRGSETILVVEDEEVVRRLVDTVLTMGGYEVIRVADGAEAIRACEDPARRVDLLLTDVVLPSLSGKEVYERLVADRPALRVLYMSGYTDDAIVHHGVSDPSTPFLHKPFSAKSLKSAVRAVLDGVEIPRAD